MGNDCQPKEEQQDAKSPPSWGICEGCGYRVIFASLDKQGYECSNCTYTISLEQIRLRENASREADKLDIMSMWDIVEEMERKEAGAMADDDRADVEDWDWTRIDALITEYGPGRDTAEAMTARDVLRAFDEAHEAELTDRSTPRLRARRLAADIAVSLVYEQAAEAACLRRALHLGARAFLRERTKIALTPEQVANLWADTVTVGEQQADNDSVGALELDVEFEERKAEQLLARAEAAEADAARVRDAIGNLTGPELSVAIGATDARGYETIAAKLRGLRDALYPEGGESTMAAAKDNAFDNVELSYDSRSDIFLLELTDGGIMRATPDGLNMFAHWLLDQVRTHTGQGMKKKARKKNMPHGGKRRARP